MSEHGEDRITVVIPTWNGWGLLDHCLASLRAQRVLPAVLVVDNGSTDETGRLVASRYPEVDCLRLDSNQGFARAVNRGIAESRTPAVALLNNDTEADPGWIEAGLRGLEGHPDYSFFASRMMRFQERRKLDSAGDCYNRRGMPYKRGQGEAPDRYLEKRPVLGASAGAAFYRRSLFEKVGYFDEAFRIYLEDVELSLRAQCAGHRCLYLPDAVVYHIEAASDPGRKPRSGTFQGVYYSPNRVYWITRNRWRLMVLYQPLRNLHWLALGWSRSALFHLWKVGFSASFFRGILAGLAATPQLLGRRLRLRRQRTLSTGQLCRLLRQC